VSSPPPIDGVPAWQSYLELLRLPNIFTAMADVAMGFFFVQPAWAWDANREHLLPGGWWVLAMLVAASSLLYAAGVVLNDIFDLDEDRIERPDRPLPSGRVSLPAAQRLAGEMLLAGLALAVCVTVILWRVRIAAGAGSWVALRPAAVATLLALAIVLYDAVLKRTPLGPPAMGACRMLNVLLGMSVSRAAWGAGPWLVAAAIGVYVTGLTWFARDDAGRSDRRKLAAAAAVMAAGVALLAWLPRWTDQILPAIHLEPGGWYLLIALLGSIIGARCLWAIAEPEPQRVRVAVGQAIASLVFLDAAACYASCGPVWAALVLLLLIPTTLLGRWIAGT
jgi:4-hydroxybenzoate polyprenyltransferase